MKKIVIAGLAALVATPLSALAYEQGNMIVRVGATTVDAAGDFEPDGVSAGDNTQLGLNFVYMATDNIGVEVLAATPFEHDIETKAGKVGTTKHLPPTVSAQYYFNNSSIATPYVGAGINYTVFFDEKVGANNIELKNSVGLALQVGVDVALGNNWGVNVDIRQMDIDTEVKGGNAEVEIDPMVYSLTALYKF